MSIAWQRFHAAALALARTGSVKERLHRAFRQHLADLDPSELPIEVRSGFLSLSRELTRERAMRGEDPVAATIRKLSSSEVDELAGALIALYGQLSRLCETNASATPEEAAGSLSIAAAGGGARVIPLFAEARP